MPNILRQKRSIIYLVILIFVLNSIITSCRRKNATELTNSTITTLQSESLSTESISTEPLSTSSSDTKQTGDATTTEPVETETQIPKELRNLQEMISPVFRISKASTKILRAKDGVIYTVPDNDDMQKQRDSFDFKTGEPTYKLKYNVYSKEKDAIDNSQKITKTITFNIFAIIIKCNRFSNFL